MIFLTRNLPFVTETGDLSINSSSDDEPSPSFRLKELIKQKKLSRTRKFRIIKKTTSMIKTALEKENLVSEDEMAILVSISDRLEILQHKVKINEKETRGRKQCSLEIRQKAWDFWHSKSSVSTITLRPAKLNSVPLIQKDLTFNDNVKEVRNKRNITLYESPWFIPKQITRELHQEFNATHDLTLSGGTFLALKPFYVRAPSAKDMEMCLCKTHLHARWAVNALNKLSKEQKIKLGFKDYATVLDSFYSPNCAAGDDMYIKWECSPNKKTLCAHIRQNYKTLKDELLLQCDSNLRTKMIFFDKIEVVTKQGKVVKKLKPISTDVNILDVLDSIDVGKHNSSQEFT